MPDIRWRWRSHGALLLAAVLAGTMAGCGSGDARPDAGGATETPIVAPGAPTGCRPNRDGLVPGSTVIRKLMSNGVEREYRLHMPAKTEPGPPPLVLNWHGLGSGAGAQEAYSGLVPLSDRHGFVLVSPEGTGAPRGFASFPGIGATDDVQFARDLMDAVSCDAGTDPARVYSTGLSNGAFMSSRIGCELGDRIAAIAPVAGVFVPPAAKCERAMPVLAFHGTADAIVPYEKGLILGLVPYDGAMAGARDWAMVNASALEPGCDSFATGETTVSDHVQRFAASGCGHQEVLLVVVDGGGHTWPGAIDVPSLGATTHEISASEMIWEFFKDKRTPAR